MPLPDRDRLHMTRRGIALVWCAGVAAVLTVALPLSAASGMLISTSFVYCIFTNRLFALEGYLTVLAAYYWLGIVNPFEAEIHGVTLSQSTVRTMIALVVVGGLFLWAGGLVGRRLPGQSQRVEPDYATPDRLT